jgi:hypothetical protein
VAGTRSTSIVLFLAVDALTWRSTGGRIEHLATLSHPLMGEGNRKNEDITPIPSCRRMPPHAQRLVDQAFKELARWHRTSIEFSARMAINIFATIE